MQVALIDQVTKPLQGIAKQMQATVSVGRKGMENMARGGAGLMASGFAIQNALAPAIEMEQKLGEVKSLSVNEEALKQLQATALSFSIEYGKSAVDVVSSAYDIKSAFGDITGDELSSLTKSSAVLAAATKADASTITNYMGTMVGIFKNSADEMGLSDWSAQVAGMTALSVEMFKTTGSGMSSAFTSVGAEATSAGIAMNEQMAILGTLQATMSGSEAGTKYKAFLGGVAKAQDALNLSFTDSQGQMLPMLDILEQLKGKYGSTIDVAESAELAKAFGTIEATSMIKLLMADTEGLAQSMESLGDVKGMEKAEVMAASMTTQWGKLDAVWFAVRASIFGAVLPAIEALVGVMVGGLEMVMGWVDTFPLLGQILGAVAIVGLSFAGVVAGISLAIGIAQMMSAGWGVTMKGLGSVLRAVRTNTLLMTASTWLFNAALWANPVTWVVGGILALVVAIGAAIYYWDEIKACFSDIDVFNLLGESIEWIIDLLNKIPGIDIEVASKLPKPEEMSVAQLTKNVGDGVGELNPSTLSVATSNVQRGGMPALTVGAYKRTQNQIPLPSHMVQNITTTQKQNTAPTRQYGDVFITTQNAITPDQLEQWDELNAG